MMAKDKHYYRSQTNAELIEEVRRGIHVAWSELAIVLAERVEDNERDWDCPNCE